VHPLMRRLLTIAIALLSLGELALAQWAVLAWRGAILPLGQALALLLAIAALNAVVFPLLRTRLRGTGAVQWLSRAWVLMSVAALFTGIALTPVFLLVGGTAWLAGFDALGRSALLWLGGAVIATGFGSVAWGATVGNQRVRVDDVRLPLRDLHDVKAPLAQLRIAHVTDLHIGPLLQAPRLRGFVDRINALEADLIVLTGDLFDFDPAYVESGCRELGRLYAVHGVYAVTGNHDVYTGTEVIADALARHSQVRLLRDAWERIDVAGGSFVVAGIDDSGEGWTERDSESPALEELAGDIPDELPCLLLAHRPSYFEQAARLGFSLVLSGHTHGGQVALPLAPQHNVSRAIADRTRGVFHKDGSTLYVNRGLGMAGLPLRINCPREIALIRLVATEA